MWKEGSIRVNGEVFHYWMKQYDKGSEWGIDGGRISKLIAQAGRQNRLQLRQRLGHRTRR